ncbi:MAG TPA: hypothetical protein DCM86_05825 [Verrucomicrobiales bacterium]|nr:hypothetical protein [Verrucomicrobiales bacterium]
MASLGPNTCVHLGPGTFVTAGYYEGITGSWQLKPGMRIVGSGIDVTVIQRVNATNLAKQFYAMGHDLALTTPSVQPNLADFCEITSLTIDCNFANLGNASASAGAIRMMGNHCRVVRVRAKNWGAKSSTVPGFVLLLLTGNTNSGNASSDVSGVVNCGIEECIVNAPDAASATRITALHVGAKENPGTTEAFGIGPYIRNCYVDGGAFVTSRSGVNMSWCREGIIEGNQIVNVYCGGPSQGLDGLTYERGAQDVTLRNNIFRNVAAGPYYAVSSAGINRLTLESNLFEMTTGIAPPAQFAVLMSDSSAPTPPYGTVILRTNRVQNLNEGSSGAGAFRVQGATNLRVEQNGVLLGVTDPIRCTRCSNASFLENRTPAGSLIQGYDETTLAHFTELATDADDAFILSLLLRK